MKVFSLGMFFSILEVRLQSSTLVFVHTCSQAIWRDCERPTSAVTGLWGFTGCEVWSCPWQTVIISMADLNLWNTVH